MSTRHAGGIASAILQRYVEQHGNPTKVKHCPACQGLTGTRHSCGKLTSTKRPADAV